MTYTYRRVNNIVVISRAFTLIIKQSAVVRGVFRSLPSQSGVNESPFCVSLGGGGREIRQ